MERRCSKLPTLQERQRGTGMPVKSHAAVAAYVKRVGDLSVLQVGDARKCSASGGTERE